MHPNSSIPSASICTESCTAVKQKRQNQQQQWASAVATKTPKVIWAIVTGNGNGDRSSNAIKSISKPQNQYKQMTTTSSLSTFHFKRICSAASATTITTQKQNHGRKKAQNVQPKLNGLRRVCVYVSMCSASSSMTTSFLHDFTLLYAIVWVLVYNSCSCMLLCNIVYIYG